MKIIGHGVDIVSIGKMKKLLGRSQADYVARVFSDKEKEEIQNDAHPEQKLAGKFAGKEAALKALGTGLTNGISWKEIEILTLANGAPLVKVSGKAAEIAKKKGIDHWVISLSHSEDAAVGSVIACSSV